MRLVPDPDPAPAWPCGKTYQGLVHSYQVRSAHLSMWEPESVTAGPYYGTETKASILFGPGLNLGSSGRAREYYLSGSS